MTEVGDAATDDDFHRLLGARVALHGLSRTELNGQVGKVLSWHESNGRAGVLVDGRTDILAIRPANLRTIPYSVGDDTSESAQEAGGGPDPVPPLSVTPEPG